MIKCCPYYSSFRDAIGNYNLYVDEDEEPYVCYGASVFWNEEANTYLYRSKFGSWVVGKLWCDGKHA